MHDWYILGALGNRFSDSFGSYGGQAEGVGTKEKRVYTKVRQSGSTVSTVVVGTKLESELLRVM